MGYRLFLIAGLALIFAVLVIIENIALLATTTVGPTSLSILLLPYFLSWILLFFAGFFGRIAYELHKDKARKPQPVDGCGPTWTSDSRPCTPSVYDIETHSQCSQDTLIHGDSLNGSFYQAHSPHYIPEENSRNHDLPPGYEEVMSRRMSGGRAVSAPCATLSVGTQRVSFFSNSQPPSPGGPRV
ncbi:unnamed protein product, partial [Mesorhabditis spiculigera]